VTDWTKLSYQDQLQAKVDWLVDLLSPLTSHKPQVYKSAEHSYRMRAEFRAWHEGEDTFYAMYEPGTNQTYGIRDFPPASKAIREMMPRIMDEIKFRDILRNRLFRIEFMSTTTDELLVSLIYHKPLDDEWKSAAESLASSLEINLIGRAKKTKILIGNDYVTETLRVNGESFQMRQIESTFTQPNGGVNEQMVSWACQQASQISETDQRGDLLELYCGNGNFTAVLAQYFNQVLATEISKISVRSAQTNFALNGVDNVSVVRMSSEEFTQALNGERPFRRLAEIDLQSYDFSTIFVDPPRAGLDQGTLALAQHFDRILYISCNPESLRANLDNLCSTHDIVRSAIFDQFPWTHHLESGVLLQRRL